MIRLILIILLLFTSCEKPKDPIDEEKPKDPNNKCGCIDTNITYN